jgi:hypothetical protein
MVCQLCRKPVAFGYLGRQAVVYCEQSECSEWSVQPYYGELGKGDVKWDSSKSQRCPERTLSYVRE